MPQIEKHADYITMINYFSVNPSDQAGLMQVQMEDIDLFGIHQYAMRAASFHASNDGTRVFNYAHWASLQGLADWRASEDMKAHMDRMKDFDFEVDPHPYKVVCVVPEDKTPEVTAPDGLPASLAMVYCDAEGQSKLAEALETLLKTWEKTPPKGHIASWIAVSMDGVRIALYSQWENPQDFETFADGAHAQTLGALIEKFGANYEHKSFRVGSVGHKTN